MERKLISILLSLFVLSGFLYAQDENIAEINKIKKNTHYMCVTGTSSVSMEEASKNAELMLSAEVERWLSENTKEDVAGYVAKWKENVSVIETKRGTLYRSFAYVNKKDILPCYEGENIVSDVNLNDTIAKAIEISLINTEKEEEVTMDIVEMVEDKDGKQDNEPKKDAIQPEEAILTSSVEEQEIDNEFDETSVADDDIQIVPVYSGKKDNEEERRMLELSTRSELQSYLSSLKQRNKYLSSYDIADVPMYGTAYLLILDYHGIIRRYVRIIDGVFIDMATNEDISIDDVLKKYSTGANICFTIK